MHVPLYQHPVEERGAGRSAAHTLPARAALCGGGMRAVLVFARSHGWLAPLGHPNLWPSLADLRSRSPLSQQTGCTQGTAACTAVACTRGPCSRGTARCQAMPSALKSVETATVGGEATRQRESTTRRRGQPLACTRKCVLRSACRLDPRMHVGSTWCHAPVQNRRPPAASHPRCAQTHRTATNCTHYAGRRAGLPGTCVQQHAPIYIQCMIHGRDRGLALWLCMARGGGTLRTTAEQADL